MSISTRSALNQVNQNAGAANERRKSLAAPADVSKPARRATTFGLRRQSVIGGNTSNAAGKNRRLSALPAQAAPRTPARKTPSGKPRQSMLATRGPRAVQDPRDLKSKTFITQAVHRLADFLQANNYPHKDISPEDLKRLSSKEFLNIFEFLFCFIDPSWQQSTNALDEVPSLFKSLGYPFAITKAAILAPGAPHTWPFILGALSWLRELLEYDELASPSDLGQTDSAYQMFLVYVTKSYQSFLQHGESQELADIEHQAVIDYTNKTVKIRSDIERKRSERETLQAELNKLKNDPKRPKFLKQKLDDFNADVPKFENLVAQLEEHDQALDVKYSHYEDRLASLEETEKQLIDTCARYQTQIEDQESKDIDAERINMSRASLVETQTQVRERKAEFEQRVWDKELAISERWQACERAADTYKSYCQQLELTHPGGPDYSLQIQSNKQGLPFIIRDVKGELKPLLRQFVSHLRAQSLTVWSTYVEVQNELEELKNKSQDADHRVSVLEGDYKHLEAMRLAKKSRLEDDLKHKIEQWKTIEQETEMQRAQLLRMREESWDYKLQTLTASDKRKEDCLHEQEQLEVQLLRKRHDYFTSTIATFDLLTNYKDFASRTLNDFKRHLEKVTETTM